MNDQQVLTDALLRDIGELDDTTTAVDFYPGDGGSMLKAYLRDTGMVVSRLYLDRASDTVYRMPSGISGLRAMAQLLQDPTRRANLRAVQ